MELTRCAVDRGEEVGLAAVIDPRTDFGPRRVLSHYVRRGAEHARNGKLGWAVHLTLRGWLARLTPARFRPEPAPGRRSPERRRSSAAATVSGACLRRSPSSARSTTTCRGVLVEARGGRALVRGARAARHALPAAACRRPRRGAGAGAAGGDVRHVDVWRLRVGPASDARDLVRSILAGYLDAKPEALTFVHGPHGKPELESAGTLRFNFTRSGSFGLLAVTRGRDVGVDVERVEPRRALGPIADRLFGADEAAELRSLPEARRTRRFFELWTQKEAYAKALGVGLTVPLDRLRPPRGWSLVDLPLGPGTRRRRSAYAGGGRAFACSDDGRRGRQGFDRLPGAQGRAEPSRRRRASRRPCARHHPARSLPPVRPPADGRGDGRLPRARAAARHARAARVHPRRVGVPAADAEGGLARAHPAAGDGGRRRALPRVARRGGGACRARRRHGHGRDRARDRGRAVRTPR